jgi:tRNA-Thr(GGU) m(6)t(6)A37 methyltransferase TsaA
METASYTFEPIAFVRSGSKYRFEAPRQAVFARTGAFIEFVPDTRMAVAAADLAGFERIWLVFCFHLNSGKDWKAKVRPPVSPDGKRYGVFATRSPHRPNPIGLSCVELLAIEKDGLRVGPCDLLDGTPVLDIKPYIPEADAFPEAKAGWRDGIPAEVWAVTFSPPAAEKMTWIEKNSGLDIAEFCRVQLSRNPLDRHRKRVKKQGTGLYSIGCRVWKVSFSLDPATRIANVLDISSNYTGEDLLPAAPDPYSDKAIHRAFRLAFGKGSVRP